MRWPITDLTGKHFGSLVVVENWGIVDGKATYRCRCDCGTEVFVKGKELRRAKKTTCDCQRRRFLGSFSTPAEASLAYRKFYALRSG